MYDKNAAIMTKGFAILCMLILHLFCRVGNDVYGTPLLWVNETHPVAYYFGFFAEICVPLYSICAGYAQYLIFEKGKASFKNNTVRILKLLVNYWIVLFIFCGLGLILKNDAIPGSFLDFFKSIFLIHSYNGAWWYLNTYIILLLLPTYVILFPVKKIKNPFIAFSMCFSIDIIWYLLHKFEILNDFNKSASALSFVEQELFNVINVLPYFWIGCFMCKFRIVDRAKEMIDKFLYPKYQNITVIALFVLLFIITNIVHKAVVMGAVAVATFILFNLINKANFTRKIFLFLGKHSTNMWLTHMFFYAVLFIELVVVAKYPLFILLFMIFLCVIASYCIKGIEFFIYKIFAIIKKS